MAQIGDVVRLERLRRRWSQQKLADKAGVTKTTISVIESGKRPNPSGKTLAGIADALDLTPDFLFQQAGWYEAADDAPLPPEVRELAEVIEAYPDGPAKLQAKQMVVDMARVLRTLREGGEHERGETWERPGVP